MQAAKLDQRLGLMIEDRSQGRVLLSGWRLLHPDREDLEKGPDKLIGLRLPLKQRLLGLFMRLAMHLVYLLDQHFPKVIKTSRDMPTEQRCGQRIAFVLFHFKHARRVQSAGFQREGSNSDRGNAGEESGRIHIQRLEPRQPLRPKSYLFECRRARVHFQG